MIFNNTLINNKTHDKGTAEEESGNNSYNVVPTAVDWVYEDPAHIVTGYSNAACIIYDIETGKSIMRMDTMQVKYFAKIPAHKFTMNCLSIIHGDDFTMINLSCRIILVSSDQLHALFHIQHYHLR